jgi:hypothetical protein
MKTMLDFIQRIMKDLKVGDIKPNLKKALELRIGEIVDEQIEDALVSSVTEEDWQIYDDYRKDHPEANVQAAMQAMVDNHPEIQTVVQDALVGSYDDIMAREEAVAMVLEEQE